MRLSLRTLFWLIVAAAVVVGWWIEHVRLTARLGKIEGHAGSTNLLRPGMTVLRHRAMENFRFLSDEDILKQFQKLGEPGPSYVDELYQGYLSEMLRRGMGTELRAHFDQLGEPTDELRETRTVVLPLLAAVRRAEGKPDPVRVRLTYQPGATITEPPLIVPVLENVDVEEETIELRTSGDFGTRRVGCWQIQLADETGRRVPLANRVEATGGFAGFQTFQYGAKDDQGLDVRSYVEQPPPGKYKLQVFFNTEDIAGDPDLTGLIVFGSDPVDVIVTHASRGEGVVVIPLLLLLYSALLATVVAIVVRRWRNPKGSRPALVTWRDALAWVVLIALSLAWYDDVWQLRQQIELRQFDEDAEWTWRQYDGPPVRR